MNNGKICVSVCAENADDFIANIKRAAEFADVIELRFDCLNEPAADFPEIFERLEDLKGTIPWLATYRPKEQGGRRAISGDERISFWKSGFCSEFADLEEDVIDIAGEHYREGRICSFHDLRSVPRDLSAIYERLSATGAEIIKIAVTSEDIVDTIAIWKLLERANAENRKFIPIAMGDAGKWTRILGLAHGAFMTYASLETGNETAPGQVTAADLTEVYRVRNLDKETEVFGVIGDPISQSVSPYMHNPAFSAAGVNAVFVPLLVKDIGEFFRRMVRPETREIDLNFAGFSVTMPHKQTIIPFLDDIDPTAAAIGAVNTVKIDNGKLTGYNTDAPGFIMPLKEKYGELRDARVAVIGAGGAARAVVFALKQENADVTIFARDEKKAAAFADEFGVNSGDLSDLTSDVFGPEMADPDPEIPNFKFQISNTDSRISDLKSQFTNSEDQTSKFKVQTSKLSHSFDILVDTTPIGMKGPRENDSLFTADQLDGLKFVYDLVTKPVNTPILRAAKSVGILTLGGIEMLIAQGARQFEIWTGGEAPLDVMRSAAKNRMEQLQK